MLTVITVLACAFLVVAVLFALYVMGKHAEAVKELLAEKDYTSELRERLAKAEKERDDLRSQLEEIRAIVETKLQSPALAVFSEDQMIFVARKTAEITFGMMAAERKEPS